MFVEDEMVSFDDGEVAPRGVEFKVPEPGCAAEADILLLHDFGDAVLDVVGVVWGEFSAFVAAERTFSVDVFGVHNVFHYNPVFENIFDNGKEDSSSFPKRNCPFLADDVPAEMDTGVDIWVLRWF